MSKNKMVSLKSQTANALPEKNKETVANSIMSDFDKKISQPNGTLINDMPPASKQQPKGDSSMGLVQ